MLQIRTVGLSFLLVSLASNAWAAHPAHSSLTEIEWNAESRCFEVAMKLSIPDLEDAISVADQQRFRMRDDQTSQRRIARYLQKHFALLSEANQKSKQTWIGMQLELHEVWCYFELRLESATARKGQPVQHWDQLFEKTTPKWNPEKLIIRHSALCEVQPEQSNIVSYAVHDKKTSLVLNVKQLQAPVQFQQTARTGWSRPSKKNSQRQ